MLMNQGFDHTDMHCFYLQAQIQNKALALKLSV